VCESAVVREKSCGNKKCGPVSVSVCLSFTSRILLKCSNGWRCFFGMETSFHLSSTVPYGNSGIFKIKKRSPNSGLRKFSHSKSIMLSTKRVDGRDC